MKHKSIFTLLVLISISCHRNTGTNETENPSEKLRKEAVIVAEDYAQKQLKNAKITTNINGYITVEDSLKKYIFDPASIVTGLIDEDSTGDAIVTLTSFIGEDVALIEHLVLLNTNGNLMLIKSVEADMKILSLSDRVITVEIHTKPRNSPLYNCAACRAIIYYKYRDGDLQKIEDQSTSSQD
jgi:hypothetical protein